MSRSAAVATTPSDLVAALTAQQTLAVATPARCPEVTFDAKGNMKLPAVPSADDPGAMCAWLTATFNLNRAHPIVGGEWQGHRGPDGHIALRRADAPELRFEPARTINNPMQFIAQFTGRRTKGDGMLHAYKGEHCRQIAYVVEMLCDTADALTEAQEALGIVGTFLQIATPVNGCTTYGTPAQRFEAARALRREVDQATGRHIGPARYLLDARTGERIETDTGELLDEGRSPEIVIAVSELADAARRHVGSSLPRGWLDARMQCMGWQRITVDGHQMHGRAGRYGSHATVRAYRGRLVSTDGPVTT